MRRRAITALLACAGLLLLVAASVRCSGALRELDQRGFDALSGGPSDGGAVRLLAGIADPLPFVVLVTALVCAAVVRGRPRAALAIAAIATLAALSTEALKRTLDQGTLHGGAFPSGHTTAAFALTAGLVIAAPERWRRTALLAGAALATAIGLSTVRLGWHTPTDVVGGFLVAATVTAAVVIAAQPLSGSAR